MKRTLIALLLIIGACVAGLACAEFFYRWPAARDVIARASGRGELVAVVNGAGIYESDLHEGEDVAQLIIAANLRRESSGEPVNDATLQREVELLRHQFGPAEVFDAQLEASGLSAERLRATITEHLRAQQWIEKQIAPELHVTDQECSTLYQSKQEWFAQPVRFRVSHLFLAAPEVTPPDAVQAKQDAARALAKRLTKGEDFALLIAEASEDEATKDRGGDLGFFSAERMPPDFIAEVEKLAPGKPGKPVRLQHGFHILQLTEGRPARQMPFEEVQAEIALHLANGKRGPAVERLQHRLAAAEFIRTPL
ncbi:MAG TPA: peptidylprolyl isomerase [Chthoniobacterales bacterium]|nr:peptidylprolyl isomerase [Chthoniobacterales bacterium]